MAKKPEGEVSQQDKIRAMIVAIGWDASPDECVDYLKKTYGLELEKAYVSQLRSAERKRQGMPPLRIRKGSKAAKVRKNAVKTPEMSLAVATETASPVDITLFVMEMKKWQDKLGDKTIKAVLQTMSK
ncbi:hypothetical protein [Zavarzinella formosa]|uniref:hypothetical protein n=1 Tax=Zavarzinella formosa TaxID=360055 RepID=UPI000307E9EC|nr:hypothetical protein [Zavarzinella formosa]